MPEKPSKLMPAVYGGIIMGVISGIPFLSLINCLCCAGIMFGGFMAVFFYKKDLKPEHPPLTSGDGVTLGALAGVFGAIVGTILTVIIFYAVGDVARQAIYRIMEDSGVMESMPPEARNQMEHSMSGSALSVASLFFAFILDPLFGLLGGLIGYGVFKPKAGTTMPMPPMQPPPQA